MKFVIEAELTPTRFSEIARPYRIFHDEVRGLVAVCSEMPYLGYPGRWFYTGQPHRHRVSLYDAYTFQRKAVVSTQYPVHDVAFHALEPKILIGTGSYDGGYMYEGDFFLYDWVTEELTSLLGETREVLACRFTDEGRFAALLSPSTDDEDFGKSHFRYGDFIWLGVVIDGPIPSSISGTYAPDPRLNGLQPCHPADFGFDIKKLAKSWREKAPYGEADMSLFTPQGYQERYGIWDLRWIDADHFAVALNGCHLEIWHKAGNRIHRFDGQGRSIEFYPHQDGGLIIHFLEHHLDGARGELSQLWKWDGAKLEMIAEFDRAYAFTWNTSGQLLGIDCSHGSASRIHVLMDGSARILKQIDCARQYLMSVRPLPSGLENMFYLKGKEEEAWENRDYRLWRMTSLGEEMEIGKWSQTRGWSTYYSGFVWNEDRVVVVGESWDDVSKIRLGPFLDILSPLNGHLAGSVKLDAPVTCVISVLGNTAALVGHTSGGVTLVPLTGGESFTRQEMVYEGLTVVPSTMIEQDGCIIIGTPEGRLFRGRLEV